MAHPPAAAVRPAFAPAFLGQVVQDEDRGLGEVKKSGGFTSPMIPRYMRNALENSRATTMKIMIWSPIWTQATGAKVLSSTRSVTTGPWPRQEGAE